MRLIYVMYTGAAVVSISSEASLDGCWRAEEQDEGLEEGGLGAGEMCYLEKRTRSFSMCVQCTLYGRETQNRINAL